ncbi:MAG: efflux RND transporter periplasmic adaptor subunit [Calditrichaeota bacterium]|nr:efflux RND transporter periplasmic adaptor subunit [Calditrichota bacterium]
MAKKIFSIFLISGLAIALLTGCGKKGNTNEDALIIPVETTPVIRKDVSREVTYTGDIKAEKEVKVYSKIPDRIVKFEVDEGDYVKKGDVIARIEATKIEQAVVQAKAGLASARAQFANVKAEFERSKRLKAENAISEQQFDATKTQFEATKAMVEQAEAALVQAESQLDDAIISSPLSGIIGTRNYEEGDMATGPLPIVTVVQMNRVKVIIKAPEQDFGQLKVGQFGIVKVRSYPDETFKGKIIKISPVLDPLTRMGKIELLVDNKDKRLKPGMFAEVQIRIQALKNVIAIPKFVVIEKTELQRVNGEDVAVVNSHVFVVQDSVAHLRKVEISYTNGTISVVKSGVEEGEQIVVVGQQSLKDGSRVRVLNEGEK